MARVTIDLDQVLSVAHTGVRRAIALMGFGINAADDPGMVDCSLAKYSIHRLSQDTNLPPPFVASVKSEFHRWVVVNGLRELLESLEAYLNEVHHVCLVGQFMAKSISADTLNARLRKYADLGFSDKIDGLVALGVALGAADQLRSLYRLRNCVTHRRGVVGEKDCKGSAVAGHLVASWRAFALEGRGESGTIVQLTGPFGAPITEPFVTTENTEVIGRWVVREVQFPLGASIDLSASQVAEICLFVRLEADMLWKATVEYLQGPCGVTLIDKSSPPTIERP